MHYSYTGAWNFELNQPLLGETWLDAAEARARWEAGTPVRVVVRAEADAPVRSVLTVADGAEWQTLEGVDANGSIVVRGDFRLIEGRLFLDRVTTWTYPTGERHFDLDEAVRLEVSTLAPDGSGSLTFEEGDETTTVEARDVPVADHWVDAPAFGAWEALVTHPALSRGA